MLLPSSKIMISKKGKIFYGQEPPSGESTTTECGVIYQLLAVTTEVAQWGTPSCSRLQPARDNGARDGRTPTFMGSAPWSPRCTSNAAYKSQDLLHQPGLERASTGNGRPTHYLCGHSG